MAFSCVFVGAARACPHEPHELFQSEYQRTNRTNRTKIVRCFPHCCPRHVPRSYCGSSMRLQVHAPVDAVGGIALDLRVFARFRSVETTAIVAGSIMAAAPITSAIQSDRNTTAEWIDSRVLQAPFQGFKAWLFELNPSGRWYYAWDSGATKARRQTGHVLETLVVITREGGRNLEVVATLCSSSFTFVSFRRSADWEVGEQAPSLLYQALSWQMRQNDLRESESTHANSEAQPVQSWHGGGHQIPVTKPCVESFVNSSRRQEDPVDFAGALGQLIAVVERLPSAKLPSALAFWASDRCHSRFHIQDALDTAIELVWWLRTDSQLAEWSAKCWFSTVDVLFDMENLRQAYSNWLKGLEKTVHRFLGIRQWTIHDLATVVADEEPPCCRHAYDWVSFVANVRQLSIDRQLQRLRNPRTDSSNVLFTCDLGDVNIRRTDYDGKNDSSYQNIGHLLFAGSVFFFWSQLSRLRIDSSELRTTCTLRIWFCMESERQHLGRPLEFILDHRHRHFSSLPRGDATLSGCLPGNYSSSDYIGMLSPYSDRIHITTWLWPQSTQNPAYRWHWTTQPPIGSVLSVSVRIDVGSWQDQVTTRDQLETAPIQTKLAMVERWQPVAEAVLPYKSATKNTFRV